MKNRDTSARRPLIWLLAFIALLSLSACASSSTATVNTTQPQQTVTVNAGFQKQVTPLPTIPSYRCGAWTSNNAPNPGETIFIYARLTHNLQPVQDMQATATVHFSGGDTTLDQVSSDNGGYVKFQLDLQNRQPAKTPATIDVTFSGVPSGKVSCETFFTPN